MGSGYLWRVLADAAESCSAPSQEKDGNDAGNATGPDA
jgi:hypothetical protein